MLSFNIGKPIGKIDNEKNQILSIVDPDNDEDKKELDKIKKRNKNKTIKKCCKHHSKSYCKREECCYNCPFYYESESDSEDDCDGIGFKEFKTKDLILPFPDLTARFTEYIGGPSGVGKSTMASELAMKFKQVFPEKKIFIFSRTDAKKDPAYAKLNPIQIDITDDLITNPIDITNEISEDGCLIIFDDCGTINNIKLRKEIEKLICDILEVGRKLNANIIITNHLLIPNDKNFARTLMNETKMITVFPRSGSQPITYVLKTYFGLTKKQIERIISLDSRWVRISKSYPMYVEYKNGAYII